MEGQDDEDEECAVRSAKMCWPGLTSVSVYDTMQSIEEVFLVGINYDRDALSENPEFKHHTCVIEQA